MHCFFYKSKNIGYLFGLSIYLSIYAPINFYEVHDTSRSFPLRSAWNRSQQWSRLWGAFSSWELKPQISCHVAGIFANVFLLN